MRDYPNNPGQPKNDTLEQLSAEYDMEAPRSRGLHDDRNDEQKRLKVMHWALVRKFGAGNPSTAQQDVLREVIEADKLAQNGRPERLEALFRQHIDPNYQPQVSERPKTTPEPPRPAPSGYPETAGGQNSDYLKDFYSRNAREWHRMRDNIQPPAAHTKTADGFDVDVEEAARELFQKMHIDIHQWDYHALWMGNQPAFNNSSAAETVHFTEFVRSGKPMDIQRVEFKKSGAKSLTFVLHRKNGIVSEYTIQKGAFDRDSEIYYNEGQRPKDRPKAPESLAVQFDVHPSAREVMQASGVVLDEFNEMVFLERDINITVLDLNLDSRTKKMTFHKSGTDGIGIECQNIDGSVKRYFIYKGEWKGEA